MNYYGLIFVFAKFKFNDMILNLGNIYIFDYSFTKIYIFYYYDFCEMPVLKKNQQARCFYALSSKSCNKITSRFYLPQKNKKQDCSR